MQITPCFPHLDGAKPLYATAYGFAYVGDALALLNKVPDESVDLVFTSPPFPLSRPKKYGNVPDHRYIDWFLPFAREVERVLKPTGSFVVELGWVYKPRRPVRSLYNIELLVKLCQEYHWILCQEFIWFNPAKIASPAEWVTIRKIRVKDACSPIWWLSKTIKPQAHWKGIHINDDLASLSHTQVLEIQHPLWTDDSLFIDV